MKYIVWTFFLLLTCTPLTQTMAQRIVAKATLESKMMTIGDQQELSIQVPYLDGLEITGSSIRDLYDIEQVEILDTTAFTLVDLPDGKVYQQTIRLTSFDSGQYFIPEIPVRYQYQNRAGQVKTPNLLLNVATVQTQEDLVAPIKPIAEEPINLEDIWPYLAIVLGLILIVYGIYYFRLRKTVVELPPPPPPPAHELALQKLEALKNKQLWQKGEVKTYHSELSYILREYIENRFDIQALEQTTTEIQQALQTTDISKDWKTKLGELLQTADMVKFAKVIPPASFHEETWKQITAFVRSTKKIAVVQTSDTNQ